MFDNIGWFLSSCIRETNEIEKQIKEKNEWIIDNVGHQISCRIEPSFRFHLVRQKKHLEINKIRFLCYRVFYLGCELQFSGVKSMQSQPFKKTNTKEKQSLNHRHICKSLRLRRSLTVALKAEIDRKEPKKVSPQHIKVTAIFLEKSFEGVTSPRVILYIGRLTFSKIECK